MRKMLVALSAVLALSAVPGQVHAGSRGDLTILVEDRGDGEGDRVWDRQGGRHDTMLGQRRIERMLMRRNFVSIELRRDRYIVRAVRPSGALVRLAVDAYDGTVIARERLGRASGRDHSGDRAPGHDDVELAIGGATTGIYGR